MRYAVSPALIAWLFCACRPSFSPPPGVDPPAETKLTTVLVASGFLHPVQVAAAPGDRERIFVVEQDTGRMRIVRLETGQIDVTPFLDIGARITAAGNEQGFLGVAFHPRYAENGFFFVNYTDRRGDTVIARYSVSGDADVADADSEVVILGISQPEANHNGGCLRFGPDGMLYVGMGDGGGAFDLHGEFGNAQNPRSLLGKIHRLDVDAPPPYIPADNPFVGDDNRRPETWATGLRNPWRFSFDRESGDLYIADVGQNEREEIDVEPAGTGGGRNYGWRCLEGTRCTGFNGCACDDDDLVAPVFEYDHDAGCSVTGGVVYRGAAMPALRGTYFLADYCSNLIMSFRYAGGEATERTNRTQELAPGGGRDIVSISSIDEDAAGELYICDHFDGAVFKIVAVPDLSGPP